MYALAIVDVTLPERNQMQGQSRGLPVNEGAYISGNENTRRKNDQE